MAIKWSTPVGIELTWIPDFAASKRMAHKPVDYTRKYRYHYRFQKLLKAAGHNDIALHVSTDPDYTIELPSPQFKSKKEAKQYWGIVEPIAQKAGLIKESEFFCTGAGHLNVNAKDAMHAWKLVGDFAARPYIAWAFNDLADDNYAQNHFFRYACDFDRKRIDHRCPEVGVMLDYVEGMQPPQILKYGNSKYSALHIRGEANHWLEFRPFSAARTWKEQEAHLDFIQAYMQWVDRNPIIEKMPFMTSQGMQAAFTADTAVAAFKQLIADLGLKWDRYAEYEEVLRYRFTMGPQYLC